MDQGVLDTVYLALRHPGEGLRRVAQDKPLVWSLFVCVVAAGVWRASLVLGSAREETGLFGSSGFLDVLLWSGAALIVLFAVAGVVHLTSRLLQGYGTYLGLVCVLALVPLPLVFFAPLSLLNVLLGPPLGLVIYIVGWVALWVWAFVVLGVIAVRQNYDFSTRRAMGAYFLPVAVLLSVLLVWWAVALIF
jgi:hypothetical protein